MGLMRRIVLGTTKADEKRRADWNAKAPSEAASLEAEARQHRAKAAECRAILNSGGRGIDKAGIRVVMNHELTEAETCEHNAKFYRQKL